MLGIWREVMRQAQRMIGDYHERSSLASDGHLVDKTLRYFSTQVGMTGREGVLCLGPLEGFSFS